MQNEMLDNPFWHFSLRFYRALGVAEVCLALQERCRADVNVLLFALWLAREGRGTGEREFLAIEDATARWRDEAIRPLRELRTRLKRPELLADPARAALRESIKAIELQAERIEQRDLFRLAQDSTLFVAHELCGDALAARNLQAYETHLDADFGGAPKAALLNAWRSLAPG